MTTLQGWDSQCLYEFGNGGYAWLIYYLTTGQPTNLDDWLADHELKFIWEDDYK